MTKDMKRFIKLCKQTQSELKGHMISWLKGVGYKPIVEKGFVLAMGSLPVCVTAHLDTVHKERVKKIVIENDDIISSPQGIGGDDRCGVFMIQKIVEAGYKPTILFCEDEEIGGVGSDAFCLSEHSVKLNDMKFFIELDRANNDDLVFYDDDNQDFHKFCEEVTGYKENWGSFSDISSLCPQCKVSGVNISCGYYNAHKTTEYVIMSEMFASIEAAKKLLDKANEVEQFEYIEVVYQKSSYGYGGYWGRGKNTTVSGWSGMYFVGAYNGKLGDVQEYIEAESEMEAVGIFLSQYQTLTYGEIYDIYDMGDYDYYRAAANVDSLYNDWKSKVEAM